LFTAALLSSPVQTASSMLNFEEARVLSARFEGQPTVEVLRWAWERFGSRAAIGTSFQGAGLVMMHLARTHGFGFPVFTLDTGLLFSETVDLKKRLEEFFGYRIESLEPDLSVQQQAAAHGAELWKRDPDLCCTMRKVLPLQSKLADLDCWITGLRRQQSETRSEVGVVEVYTLDEATGRDLVKLSPMAGWTRESVWEYIRKHQIPFNPLHDRGYSSIGCWPCTKQSGVGDNERAGRWLGFKKVECGIHTFLAKKT
jgi:phosphoadenosine phosphosulfate reductase